MEIDGWFIRRPQRKVVRGWGQGDRDGDALPPPTPISPPLYLSIFFLTFCHLHLFHVTPENAAKNKQKVMMKAEEIRQQR